VLANASRGIAEVITHHYTQNIDLRDAKTVLADSGTAIMGSATSSGPDRGEEAVAKALDSPLLNDNKIIGAKNVLLLVVSGGDEVTIDEIGIINEHIQREAGHGANIIMGIGEDASLGEDIAVTVIATGFDIEQQEVIVHADPKKIIHTLNDEQTVVHTLESDMTEADLFSGLSPKAEDKQQIEEHVETTDVIRSIEVFHEEISEPTHEPLPDDEEFIIHELPSEVNEIDVVDHEEIVAETKPFDSPIEKAKQTKEPLENEVPVLFHLEEQPQTQAFQESKPILASVEVEKEKETPSVKKYNLEDYVESVVEEKEIQITAEPTPKEVVKTEDLPEKEEEELTPLNSTITQGLAQRAEERRKKLKSFNHKFMTNRIDELEKEPAYKRAQVDMNAEQDISRLSVDTDSNHEMRIRTNNSFLHDNVD
jgi:cell division protein FtsZ